MWKPIKNFEGLYEVSNFGRVKRLERIIVRKNGTTLINKELIKKPTLDLHGYLRTLLHNGEKKSMKGIHRLVAEVFIENPENKGIVNHKDSNRQNNHVNNLEWVTQKENIQHAFASGNMKRKQQKSIEFQPIEGEVWKNITGYDESYQISNLGRVKSFQTVFGEKKGSKKAKLRRLSNKGGYLSIGLNKDKKQSHFYVHVLVANEFIPNPYNKPYVNHINSNPSDNRVENLEWATHSENMRHKELGPNSTSKPINQYDLKGSFIKKFNSLKEALRETGAKRIRDVCERKILYSGLYQWRYTGDKQDVNDIRHLLENKRIGKEPTILQFSLKGDLLNKFSSPNKAAEFLAKEKGIQPRRALIGISKSATGYTKISFGYIWIYEDKYMNNKEVLRNKLEGKEAYPKPVLMLNEEKVFIKRFESLSEAARFLNKTTHSNIGKCCSGKQEYAYGYKWIYASCKYPKSK
ncbi:NUMOD4 domain-containing protein [Bacillus cereus]|uniref:NUMOD4 domain-containing protein n=1 Tax=Bacillus cereus TaxID=1396 RepID=UPI002EB910F6|nr:NUMOD4 domain-containing protein [Bacillus mobilis]